MGAAQRAVGLTVLMFAGGVVQSHAQSAEPPIDVSVSLRAFSNRATGPGYSLLPVPGLPPVEVPVASSRAMSFLPAVSVRSGRLGFNVSMHAPTSYDTVIPEGGGQNRFRRKEWDVSLGYSVLPNVVVAAGWKAVDVEVDSIGLNQQIRSPFIGLSLSGALTADWSLFASFAFGRPTLDAGGAKIGSTGEYTASEVGVRYGLGSLSPALKAASAVLGYRAQTFHFDNVVYSLLRLSPTGPVLTTGTHGIRAGIEGLTFGVSFVF